MTSKKITTPPKKPVFSGAFKHALTVVGGLEQITGVAETQSPYTPPSTQPVLPPKKPVKDTSAS